MDRVKEKKKKEEEEKKKKEEEEEEFFFVEKRKRRTIALFNPDRASNRHVLPSFRKVLVFFSFSRTALRSRRGKEEELS